MNTAVGIIQRTDLVGKKTAAVSGAWEEPSLQRLPLVTLEEVTSALCREDARDVLDKGLSRRSREAILIIGLHSVP